MKWPEPVPGQTQEHSPEIPGEESRPCSQEPLWMTLCAMGSYPVASNLPGHRLLSPLPKAQGLLSPALRKDASPFVSGEARESLNSAKALAQRGGREGHEASACSLGGAPALADKLTC